MLNATVLKTELKPALVAFWESGFDGSGMSVEEYADEFCQILAEKLIAHITANGVVQVTVTGVAGPYAVTGTGTGGVS